MKQIAVLVGLKGGDSKLTSKLCLLESDPQRGWSLPRVETSGPKTEALADLFDHMASWNSNLVVDKSTGLGALPVVDESLTEEAELRLNEYVTIYQVKFSGFINTTSQETGKEKLRFIAFSEVNRFITDELTKSVFALLSQRHKETKKAMATARR